MMIYCIVRFRTNTAIRYFPETTGETLMSACDDDAVGKQLIFVSKKRTDGPVVGTSTSQMIFETITDTAILVLATRRLVPTRNVMLARSTHGARYRFSSETVVNYIMIAKKRNNIPIGGGQAKC